MSGNTAKLTLNSTSIMLYDTCISDAESVDIEHIEVGNSIKRFRMVAIVKNEQEEIIASVPIAWSVNSKHF